MRIAFTGALLLCAQLAWAYPNVDISVKDDGSVAVFSNKSYTAWITMEKATPEQSKLVKVRNTDEGIELDTTAFFAAVGRGAKVVARFQKIGFEPELCGNRVSVGTSVKYSGETGALGLRLEGSDVNNKHYVTPASTIVLKEGDNPLEMDHALGQVKQLHARVDIFTGGVYSFTHPKLVRAEKKVEAPSVFTKENYILNGGAERDWYGTGYSKFENIATFKTGIFTDWFGNKYDRNLDIALDNSEKHSGRQSFRVSRTSNQYGNFYLNPVPYVPGKPFHMSFWAKGKYPNTPLAISLYVASGVSYNKMFALTTDWKKYEVSVPVWGECPAGMTRNGDPATGSMHNVMIPRFNINGVCWLDDIACRLDGKPAEYKQEHSLTAAVELDNDFRYYRVGTPVKASVAVSNLSDRDETAKISWKLLDFFGETIAESKQPELLPVAAGAKETREVVVPMPEGMLGGANLLFDVNGEISGVYFGVVAAEDKPLSHRIGVNYITGPNVVPAIRLLKDMRAGAIRHSSETEDLDCVAAFSDSGFLSMLVLGSRGATPASALVPKDMTQWSKNAYEIAQKYKGKIHVYDLLNEPNISGGRHPNPDPSLYDDISVESCARVFQAVTPAIKKADPAALISGPTTCGTDISYISGVLNAGAAKYIDLIAEHPYRQLPELPDYDQEIQALKIEAAKHGNYKLVANEAGMTGVSQFYDDNRIADYERARTAYNMRLMITALANGYDSYYHYCFRLYRPGTDWNTLIMGTMGNKGEAIPAPFLFAMRAFADIVEDGKGLGRVRLGNNYRCFLFDRGDHRVAVMWKWAGAPVTFEGSAPLSSASAYDVMGRRLPGMKFTLRDQPVYLASKLSAEELGEAIRSSGFSASGEDVIRPTLMMSEGNKCLLRLTNLSNLPTSGTATVNGRKFPFTAIASEEFQDIALELDRPISTEPRDLKVNLTTADGRWNRDFTLKLQGLAVPHTGKALTIDGDLSDWPAAAKEVVLSRRTKLPEWGADEDKLNGVMRMAWDDSNLYLAVKVNKTTNFETKYDLPTLWAGDGLQFAFDPLRNATPGALGYGKDDFEYAIGCLKGQPKVYRALGSASIYDSLSQPTGEAPEVKIAIRRNADSTVYELAFPKYSVSPFSFRLGEAMRVNVLLNIANAKGRAGFMELADGIGDGKRPDRFLDIVLTK